MKIRTDFVTNSSSSSFVAFGILSHDLSEFISELLGGLDFGQSKRCVGVIEVHTDMVTVVTPMDFFDNYYYIYDSCDDFDIRTDKQKERDDKKANTLSNILKKASLYLPTLTAEQTAKMKQMISEAFADGKTIAKTYLSETGYDYRPYFSENDFVKHGVPIQDKKKTSSEVKKKKLTKERTEATQIVDNDFVLAGNTLTKYLGKDEIVTIPNGVTTIGCNAFEKNTTLQKIIFPETLEIIEEKAFWKCARLSEAVFPQNLKKIGGAAFKETALEELVIPASVEIVEKAAFQRCESLGKITIETPKTQLVLSAYVFQCTDIEEIVFPTGVVEIGNYAISSCEKLKHVQILDGSVKLGTPLIYLDGALESISMPNGIKSFKKHTFATGVALNGNWSCRAPHILVPFRTIKRLLADPFENNFFVDTAAKTYLENDSVFCEKDKKDWDEYCIRRGFLRDKEEE